MLNVKTRIPIIAIVAFVIASFIPLAEAVYAPPTFIAVGTFATSTGADVTPALPIGWEPNDIFLMIGIVEDTDDTVTVSGWTVFTGSPFSRGTASRHWQFWRRAVAGDVATLFDKSTGTGATAVQVIAYRGAILIGDPWEVVGASATGTTDPASCTTITSTSTGALIVALLTGEDDNNAAITTTGTEPINYIEHYAEGVNGGGILVTFSEMNRQAIGATGSVSINFDVANPIGWGCRVLALTGATGGTGINSLVKLTAEAPGANCANGGTKVESGLDNGDGGGTANNGVLESGEVDSTSYVCNGATGETGPAGPQGPSGTNGTNGINGTNGTNGTNGVNGFSSSWLIFIMASGLSMLVVGVSFVSKKVP